jgi:sec-independent protein translocase protein TatC
MVDTAAAPLRKRRTKRDPEAAMPLVEHLKELRNRIGKAAVGILAMTVVGWFLYQPIYNYLDKPYGKIARERAHDGDTSSVSIAYNTIISPFTVRFHVALFVGVVVASPIWMYQIWAFIAPGLKHTEKKYAYGFLGTAIPLFLIGAALALYIMPITVGALINLAPKNASILTSADNVIDFAVRISLAFGIMFVIPVILFAMNLLGVVSGKSLAKTWRIAVFVIFVAAAIASPSPDPLTMLLLAVPVALLYMGATGLALLHDKRKARLSTEPDYSQFADDEASPIEPSDRS